MAYRQEMMSKLRGPRPARPRLVWRQKARNRLGAHDRIARSWAD